MAEFNPEEFVHGNLARHRELMILHWVCEQFAARFDHLEVLTGRGDVTVSYIVKCLRKAGYVQARKVLVGERKWVFPTRAGLNACGVTYQPADPGPRWLTHIAAINDVRLHIQQRSEETRWESERQLSVGRPRSGHRPDGVAIHEGCRVAIEVELTRKHPRFVKAKLAELEPRFDGVLYFCAPSPYRLLKAIAETGQWPNLGVRELPKLETRAGAER
jgi:hypothetical protein